MKNEKREMSETNEEESKERKEKEKREMMSRKKSFVYGYHTLFFSVPNTKPHMGNINERLKFWLIEIKKIVLVT